MQTKDILDNLNTEQKEAVLATEGPVLVLAGAGSGKTRVLVHRIAHLIDACGVMPGNILAITFTNKAADEMRNRVDDMIGFGAREIWVMTFHAACVRILRRHAELLGYDRYFTIYDTDDQQSLMKSIFKAKNIDDKMLRPRAVLNSISAAKNELMDADAFAKNAGSDFYFSRVADLYSAYTERLRANNAMDFDDLIGNTVRLFEEHPDVLALYQEKFRYLMVDEYQDTNTAQFRLVSLLAERYQNICVVGDDDQSIYRFRGANIKNILNFEKVFKNAKVIRLEQNYRSTQRILDAANEVIRNNEGRKEKRLWTENGDGTKVRLRRFSTGYEEAAYIAEEIANKTREGSWSLGEIAVLYRTNAQSRLFEEKFLMYNIPYQIVGGVNFYARREIKDMLAYLKTIENAVDDLAVTRIINVPKRGIGATSVTKIADYALGKGISFYDAALEAPQIPSLSPGAVKKIREFTDLIEGFRARSELSIPDLLRAVLAESGYQEELENEHTDEANERLDNIDELISKAAQYAENNEDTTLSGFLEEVALIADIDTVSDGDERVLLMTLHAAKGLEFSVVFMAGMEEGLFPSAMAIYADDPEAEIEEERRLCYVGITRAKRELTLTAALERMIRGDVQVHTLSRFVQEIPREMLDEDVTNTNRRKLDLPDIGFGRAMKEAMTKKAPKPYENPYTKKKKTQAAASGGIDYAVGDMVRHVKFGVGKVLDIQSGGRDFEVTVDFPAWGVKKMFAAFAKLQKEE